MVAWLMHSGRIAQLATILILFVLEFNQSCKFATFTRSSIPKLSVPVWSLATLNYPDRTTNMNVVTFATPVAIKPELYAISLFKKTLSHENFMRDGLGVLQLLTQSQFDIVDMIGKKSGRDVNKINAFTSSKVRLQDFSFSPEGNSSSFRYKILSDSLCLIGLQRTDNAIIDAGDHNVVICKVLCAYNREIDSMAADEQAIQLPLTTAYLRQSGVLK